MTEIIPAIDMVSRRIAPTSYPPDLHRCRFYDVRMKVVINGKQTEFDPPCSVRELLERQGMGNTACAVEVNRKLVPKRLHQLHSLADGDQIEIVTLVGGG